MTVTQWEVAVAVRVTAGGSDVRGIKHVGVDQIDGVEDVGVEFWMPLLDVLAPEVDALEELGALGHFAAELGGVFLLDVL